MKKVWLYERQRTDKQTGKKYGIVYLTSKFEKPLLYLDAPARHETPAVTLLVGKIYRITLMYDARQSERWQIEWLVQELQQKKLGEVKIKSYACGIGIERAPAEFQDSLRNALRLAQYNERFMKPFNLGQTTKLAPLVGEKPKRKKSSAKKKESPVSVKKSGFAKKFGFKTAT